MKIMGMIYICTPIIAVIAMVAAPELLGPWMNAIFAAAVIMIWAGLVILKAWKYRVCLMNQ